MHKIDEYLIKKFGVERPDKLPVSLPIDRTGLIKLWRKFGYIIGAEIGTDKGGFAKMILNRMPLLKLYCIDPWESYEGYIERKGERGQITLTNHYEEAKVRLTPYNCELVKKYSMDAVKDFEDESLDFVFIDGNHSYKYAMEDIEEWSKKVRKGGMISGHDYWNSRDGFGYLRLPIEKFIRHLSQKEKDEVCQVKDVIDDYTREHHITPWYVTGADDMSSWFWIR